MTPKLGTWLTSDDGTAVIMTHKVERVLEVGLRSRRALDSVPQWPAQKSTAHWAKRPWPRRSIRFLKVKGIGAVVVATGNDALTLIDEQEFRPDLVLSDYNLRGSTNGVDSIKAVRTALGWNVPAIVMTGDIRSETVEAIAAAHDIFILVKPFLGDELLRQIKRRYKADE